MIEQIRPTNPSNLKAFARGIARYFDKLLDCRSYPA